MAENKQPVNSLVFVGIGGIVALALVMASGHMDRAGLAPIAAPQATAEYDSNARHYPTQISARAACGAQGISEVRMAGGDMAPSISYVCGRYSVHSTAGDGVLVVERAG